MLTDRLRTLPRWLLLTVGGLCMLIGAGLTLRPFSSLSVLVLVVGTGLIVTGIATLVRRRGVGDPRGPITLLESLTGAAGIVAGVLVLAWPELTVRGVAIIAGLALLVGGLADIASGLRGTTDERVAATIGGAARVVFGIVSLAWRDVTILVVAVVFGLATIVFGVHVVLTALRRDDVDETDRPKGILRRFTRVVSVSGGLVVALALGAFSIAAHRGESVVDAFYDTPASVPAAPGVLLRAEPFDRAVPSGAKAWRILYTTTRAEGVPAVASGLVVVPKSAGRNLPVVAWAHGTTGIRRKCAPSVLAEPFESGALFLVDEVVANDWALVATDYVGLGTEGPHPYLIGRSESRSVLDAVRAASQLDGARLGDQTVVWGHSQGGGAALWTGILAPAYAPDLNVVGVAALAPASNLPGFVDRLRTLPGGSIFASYVVSAYSDVYPDVSFDAYVRATARTNVRALADRCLAEPATLGSVLSSVTTGFSVFRTQDLAGGALGDRLTENVPTGPMSAPLLLAQGGDDGIIDPSAQDAYVRDRCRDGQAVDYRTYPGLGHVALVQADSALVPDLLGWTKDRLRGAPGEDTCPTS